MFIATGLYTIKHGTGVDDYGDVSDASQSISYNVPGSIIEQSRTVMNQASSSPMSVRTIIGRFRPGTVIDEGDRILNPGTNQAYVVQNLHLNSSPANTPDVVVELSQITF